MALRGSDGSCFTRVKRSSSAAATITPSTITAAAASCRSALTPSTTPELTATGAIVPTVPWTPSALEEHVDRGRHDDLDGGGDDHRHGQDQDDDGHPPLAGADGVADDVADERDRVAE